MSGIMTEGHIENRLIRKAQAGDRAAFDELVMQTAPRVRAFIRSRIHADFRDCLDVDELVQDTFVRGFQSIGKFRGDDLESFIRWLLGVARIAIIKAARRLGHGEFGGMHDLVGSGVSPSRALRRDDRFNRLQETLDRLSGDYRKVIYLARIEGLPMKEIATRMRRSPEAVKKLFGRALERLREQFGDTESLHLPDRQLRWDKESHED